MSKNQLSAKKKVCRMSKWIKYLAIAIIFLPVYSYADQKVDLEKAWHSTVRETEILKERGDCYKLWGSFRGFANWDTAYKYKARRAIYNHLLPDNPIEQALIPSIHNGESSVTRLRFAIIMAVHSKPGKIKNKRYPPIDLIERFLPDTSAKQQFMACVQRDAEKDCSHILVDANVVPSYKNFYDENQRLYLQGQGSTCGAQLEINLN